MFSTKGRLGNNRSDRETIAAVGEVQDGITSLEINRNVSLEDAIVTVMPEIRTRGVLLDRPT